MNILSIETSCDETAVSIVKASGGSEAPSFSVLANLVLSQIKVHEKYGGVFPSLAKREHAKNLVPLIKQALVDAHLYEENHSASHISASISASATTPASAPAPELNITTDLSHEAELKTALEEFFRTTKRPNIDLIAVTYGPGLEPALWVGINAAKVIHEVWGIPVLPVNHMEGHISSVIAESSSGLTFPALALLISGGHTELVFVPDWLSYQIIGRTRDDAVGEAYDKVARMLGLPYPGGPRIASYAVEARAKGLVPAFSFPRPMIASADYDFSFSGLKTAVLYKLREYMGERPVSESSEPLKQEIAVAFEDAVIDTLVAKTKRAIQEYSPRSLIIAGGVIANQTIRSAFESLVAEFPETKLHVPAHHLSTDNALMIAVAAYIRISKRPNDIRLVASIRAEGNVELS